MGTQALSQSQIVEMLKQCHVDAYRNDSTSRGIDILRFKDADNILHVRAKLRFECIRTPRWRKNQYVISDCLVTLEVYQEGKTHNLVGVEAIAILEQVIEFDEFVALMESDIHNSYKAVDTSILYPLTDQCSFAQHSVHA